jgi:AcrR family transcriptional regulator
MGKREAILQATIDVIAKHGFADSPTVLIAKEAGAAELTLFRLFGSKQELLHQTFDEVAKRYQDKCWPVVVKENGAEQKLLAMYRATIKHYRENPAELAYFQQYINSAEGLRRRPDYRYEQGEDVLAYPLISILDEGKTQGVFKALPMTALVGLSGATIIMFLREEQVRNIKHTESEMDLLIQSILQAIKV